MPLNEKYVVLLIQKITYLYIYIYIYISWCIVLRVSRPFNINKHNSPLPRKHENTLVADFLAKWL